MLSLGNVDYETCTQICTHNLWCNNNNNNNNGLHFYSAFLCTSAYSKRLQWSIHSYIGSIAANSRRQRPHSHIHTPMVAGYAYQLTGGNVGFSVLPKDTSTCGQEEPGFEPPTFRSLDDLLYLLSHSRHLSPAPAFFGAAVA